MLRILNQRYTSDCGKLELAPSVCASELACIFVSLDWELLHPTLLWPNWWHLLHFIAIPFLDNFPLLLGSSGSFLLHLWGLPTFFLKSGGLRHGIPVLVHKVLLLTGWSTLPYVFKNLSFLYHSLQESSKFNFLWYIAVIPWGQGMPVMSQAQQVQLFFSILTVWVYLPSLTSKPTSPFHWTSHLKTLSMFFSSKLMQHRLIFDCHFVA